MKSISRILLSMFIAFLTLTSCSGGDDSPESDKLPDKGQFRVEVNFSENHSFNDFLVGASVSADHYVPIKVNGNETEDKQIVNVDFDQAVIILEPVAESTFINLLVSVRPENVAKTSSSYRIDFYFNEEKIYTNSINLDPSEEIWYDSFLLGTELNLEMEHKSSNNPITWDDI